MVCLRGHAGARAVLGLCAAVAVGCGASGPPGGRTSAPSTSASSTSASLTSASSRSTSTATAASPPGSLTTTSASPRAPAPSPQRLERALLADRDASPAPTSAACQVATAAQRAAAPFGRRGGPEFICQLTVSGRRAAFAVQVLGNGCYVAERMRPGRAIYGCGA